MLNKINVLLEYNASRQAEFEDKLCLTFLLVHEPLCGIASFLSDYMETEKRVERIRWCWAIISDPLNPL